MDFEFFNGTMTVNDRTPKITIRRGGLIVLNSGAVNMLGDDVEHVQLGFDAEKRAIGIRCAPKDAMGKYLLRSQAKTSSRLINGKRFLAHHSLTVEGATSFRPKDFGDGLIGFTLPADPEAETKKAAPKGGRKKAS